MCKELCSESSGCLFYKKQLNTSQEEQFHCWLSSEISSFELFFHKLSPESCGFGAALVIIVVSLGLGIKDCWHYFFYDEYEDVRKSKPYTFCLFYLTQSINS